MKVACIQCCAKNDLEENLRNVASICQSALDAGAQVIALPEAFAFIGEREQEKFAHAAELNSENPGRVLSFVQDLATKHGIWVWVGGVAERLHEDKGKPPSELKQTYNTAFVVDPGGEVHGKYRKAHLFDVDIPGKVRLCESDGTRGGEDLVCIDTPTGKLGMSICYDLRFPEMYRQLVFEQGAEILFIPAAFTKHTGEAHWATLLRARAIENQCYVVAPGQHGSHNAKRTSYGHSMIIDPWGTIIAQHKEGDGFAMASIDPNKVKEVRQNMPVTQHAKFYSPLND